MNTVKSSIKSYLILAVIVIIAVMAYFYYKGSGAPTGTSLLQTDQSVADQAAGARVLSLLSQVRALNIDNKFFQNTVYQSLRDHTVPIPTENVGRVNPFAPIPGVPSPGTVPAAGH
jgi:hypothetical protein